MQFEFGEENIKRIAFYCGNMKIVVLNDLATAAHVGRWEKFEIGPNERLMGFEILHVGGVFFYGISFLKWTLY